MQLLDDVKKAYGIAEDQQVAVLLGKGKSTISKWRASGEIPARAEKQLRKLLSEREAGAAPDSAGGAPGEPTEFETLEHRLLWEECKKLSDDEALEMLLELRRKKAVHDKG